MPPTTHPVRRGRPPIDPPLTATYARELRSLRLALHLTQAEMAEQLGLNNVMLSRYERGARRVPEPTIRLARRLK